MDLLDRYLQAVKFLLPRREQDDIIRELSDDLLSQMEDRQEALGRDLNEDEVAEVLRRRGHPVAVAGQYGRQRFLIGPVLFPLYLLVLKTGLAAALLVTILLVVVTSVPGEPPIAAAIQRFRALPGRALMVFAWTTLGFAALDFAQSRMKLSRKWDPRSLPKLMRPEDRIPFVNSVAGLLFTAAALLWLLAVPENPWLVLGPAAAFLDFEPVWRLVYVPLVIVTLATVVLHLMDAVRPYRTPARSVLKLGIDCATVLMMAVLLFGGDWFAVKPGITAPDRETLTRIASVVNTSFAIGFLLALIIAAVAIGREALRLRARRKTNRANALPA